ncbi:MAG: DUF2339 domain-containing protein [Gemmatimonadaceae bacterium]
MTTPPTLEARLARVEQVIAALSREVVAIRTELTASDPHVAPPQASRAAEPEVEPPRARRSSRDARAADLERLLGRYVMLGIAVFALVAAVGTFLSWAISHGYLHLGPAARVLIGLVFAAGIGTWGVKLRRTERSFGSSLLGLALVIVLVCAYAAGPSFNLVPTWVAFVGSAAVSWGLAIFARGQNDEPLWCVAFGGAAIAPFVTSDGSGNLYALLAYALVLLLSACFAISHRVWPVAWQIFYLSSALFVGAGTWLVAFHGKYPFYAVFALPLVVGACGVLPFAPDERKRAALRWLALLALLASVGADGLGASLFGWSGAGEILLAVALWLLMLDRLRGVAQSSLLARNASSSGLLDWVDGAALPLLLTLRAASVVPPGSSAVIAYLAALAMFFFVAWRQPVGSTRDATAFAVVAIAVAVVMELKLEAPLGNVAGLLGIALGAVVMHHARPSVSWLASGAGLLLLSAGVSVNALLERPIYAFSPFGTEASLAALLVTVSLVLVARFWRSLFDATCEAMGPRKRRTYANNVRFMLRAVVGAPWVWAFIWVLIELAMAYSASTSTLLLVTYFAATAVLAVAVGRMNGSAGLRQLGLCLALASAATAVYGATTYFDIGVRIVAYLVTSAFLLGIAYWYRRPGSIAA